LTIRYVAAPAAASITLYARWSLNYYRFQVIVLPDSPQNLDYLIAAGSTMYNLPTPARAGYIFSGWYTDAGAWENEYDFTATVMANTTIYAYWEVKLISVWIDTQDGRTKRIEVQEGKPLSLPDGYFEREGYEYMGLYTDAACTVEYDIDAPVTETLTLYVKWREIVPEKPPDSLEDIRDAIKATGAFFKNIGQHFKRFWGWYVGGLCAIAGMLVVRKILKKRGVI